MCVCESVSATLIVAYIKVSVLLIHILCSRLSVAVAGLGWACVHVLVNLKRTTAAQLARVSTKAKGAGGKMRLGVLINLLLIKKNECIYL